MLSYWFRQIGCLILLMGVTACGGSRPTHHARTEYNPTQYYPPPGPHEDPWGPYIREASGRYGVPEVWIRRVMRQESGGQEDVISWAGAMGLMQVMPETYDDLKTRYSLGSDPFDPHNNILAGTAYLREMYDRFGAPGFLAAYNAGPNRLDRYLNNGTPLPEETVNYVASLAPLLGTGTPMSGPLAVYAALGTRVAMHQASTGCDPDAAYNPDGPCTPAPPPVSPVAVAAAPSGAANCDPDAAYDSSGSCVTVPATPIRPLAVATVEPYAPADCDPDAAFDPVHPCRKPSAVPAAVIAEALPPPVPHPTRHMPSARPIQETTAWRGDVLPGAPAGRWAVQVGAFANLGSAHTAAEAARKAAPELLRLAKIELPATTPFGTQLAFRARLSGLSALEATKACTRLSRRGMACMTVAPEHGSY